VVMARHIKDMPPRFSEIAADALVPAAIEQLVFRSLAKSADDRPQSAEQMSAELDAAVEATRAASSGVQAALAEPAAPSSTRGGRLLALLAALALGVLTLGAYALSQVRQVEPASAHALSLPAALKVDTKTVTPTPSSVLAEVAPSAEPPESESSAIAESPSDSNTASAVRAGGKARQVRPHPASSAPRLQRKGNERYGRFE
jgi:hypothetical protein